MHAAADSAGLPLAFVLTPGQAADCRQFQTMLDKLLGTRSGEQLDGAGVDAEHGAGHAVGDGLRGGLPVLAAASQPSGVVHQSSGMGVSPG
ncbi:hypothetical protein ACFVHB_39920 [Kitasatospora sp. NPDC127111]|uniref:hypothetical protein n=1 Tax=Kitasatospora sp. NPDC127111 TaxID=3345363 RepID=UPI0036441D38